MNQLPAIRYIDFKAGKARGLKYPPLPRELQQPLNNLLNKFGEDSEEFIDLASDIAFIDGQWIRMYLN